MSPATTAERRVVVVEDNEDAGETLRILISRWGWKVDVAADGAQGVRLILERRPDVALVDIGLPGMSGYDVVREVRATPEGRDLYLVALTGYGRPEDRQAALAAGFDTQMVKPVEPDDLRRFLESRGPELQT